MPENTENEDARGTKMMAEWREALRDAIAAMSVKRYTEMTGLRQPQHKEHDDAQGEQSDAVICITHLLLRMATRRPANAPRLARNPTGNIMMEMAIASQLSRRLIARLWQQFWRKRLRSGGSSANCEWVTSTRGARAAPGM